VPAFFVDPATFGTYAAVLDGDFNFNSGWPIALTAASAQSALAPQGLKLGAGVASAAQAASKALAPFVGATDTDAQHVAALAALGGAKRTYMAAASPWFFTHYSPQTFNKNVRARTPSPSRAR
jgi:glucan endo-1,3-alpha-glucosidase